MLLVLVQHLTSHCCHMLSTSVNCMMNVICSLQLQSLTAHRYNDEVFRILDYKIVNWIGFGLCLGLAYQDNEKRNDIVVDECMHAICS